MKYFNVALLPILFLAACSSTPKANKVILESAEEKPSWVGKAKTVWESDGKVYFKTTQQIRGDERLNACIDLAKLNGKESLVTEIQQDVKGTLDSAETSMSENAESVLGKSRTAEFSGKVAGLRFSEQYHERFSVNDTERIDCYVLGEIKTTDYNKLKRLIVDKVQEADPRLKEAIAKKQINFFSSSDERTPASTESK